MTSVGAGCETPAEHADSATVHALLNCYLREVGDDEVVRASETPIETGESRAIRCPLPRQSLTLFVGLRYQSPTGRHLFDLPVTYRAAEGRPVPLDAGALAALLCRELSLAGDAEADDAAADLLARVLDSQAAIERYVAAREDETDALYGFETTFRAAEQSLVYGHLMHPTPKSRRGMAAHEAPRYAPERGASFPLRYVRADRSLLEQDSALDVSAVEWVREELRADPTVPKSFVETHLESDDALLPLHPWQAEYLFEQPHVRGALGDGRLEDLGAVGRSFHPTTSVRTLYSPAADFMVKGSLNVAITNSVRTNKRPELDRGVAVAELLDTEFWDPVRERFPAFDVVRDPAYLTLDLGDGAESGFEVVLRENPFRGDDAATATPVVALCQDGIDGPSRLARIVRALADREGRSTDAVAGAWFERYLDVAIRPVLWLYLARGLGLEAHQQNGVVLLEDGYPAGFRYRDNQGYYFPESAADEVDAFRPGIVERADTRCPDAIADERIRYYVVLNNAFGVINALGVAGLVDERELLSALRATLEDLQAVDHEDSSLLSDLLSAPRLPCKANLLTRFRGMDELVGSLDAQSVYTDIPNPIVAESEVHQ
ncbi:IucA/IucC family protein [Haloferacaceae archaeon DSL9]